MAVRTTGHGKRVGSLGWSGTVGRVVSGVPVPSPFRCPQPGRQKEFPKRMKLPVLLHSTTHGPPPPGAGPDVRPPARPSRPKPWQGTILNRTRYIRGSVRTSTDGVAAGGGATKPCRPGIMISQSSGSRVAGKRLPFCRAHIGIVRGPHRQRVTAEKDVNISRNGLLAGGCEDFFHQSDREKSGCRELRLGRVIERGGRPASERVGPLRRRLLHERSALTSIQLFVSCRLRVSGKAWSVFGSKCAMLPRRRNVFRWLPPIKQKHRRGRHYAGGLRPNQACSRLSVPARPLEAIPSCSRHGKHLGVLGHDLSATKITLVVRRIVPRRLVRSCTHHVGRATQSGVAWKARLPTARLDTHVLKNGNLGIPRLSAYSRLFWWLASGGGYASLMTLMSRHGFCGEGRHKSPIKGGSSR